LTTRLFCYERADGRPDDSGEGMRTIRIRLVLGVLAAGGAGLLFATGSATNSILPALAAIIVFAVAAVLLFDCVSGYQAPQAL
jgi:hypothetical protein